MYWARKFTNPVFSIFMMLSLALLANGSMALAAAVQPTPPADEIWESGIIKLPIRADNLTFVPGKRQVILTTSKEQIALLYDDKRGSVIERKRTNQKIKDATLAPSGKFAYLIGESDTAKGQTILTEIDLGNWSHKSIQINERLRQPSISFSSNQLFIGDVISSSIRVINVDAFKKISAFDQVALPELQESLFLKFGSVVEVAAIPDTEILLGSHAGQGVISIIDGKSRVPLDRIHGTATRSGKQFPTQVHPLGPIVASTKVSTSSRSRKLLDQRVSVIVGDYDGDVLAIYDYDPEFQSLDLVQVASLNLRQSARNLLKAQSDIRATPLLIATDSRQEKILVGSKSSTQLTLFRRTGKILERLVVTRIQTPPADFGISSDGSTIAVLNAGGSTLTTFNLEEGHSRSLTVTDKSKDVRFAQRALQKLGYPVGIVDGIVGRQTRLAVEAFQNALGLKPTGAVNDLMLTRLRDALKKSKIKKSAIKAEQRHLANDWFAIAGSFKQQVGARQRVREMGEINWRVVESSVCPNFANGYWIAASGPHDKERALALSEVAKKYGGYVASCYPLPLQ